MDAQNSLNLLTKRLNGIFFLLGHVVVQLLPEVFLVAGVVQQQDLLQEVRRGPLHDGVHGPDQGRPGDIGGVRESDNVTNHLL